LRKTKFKLSTKDQERIYISRSKDNKKLEKQIFNLTDFFDKLFKQYSIQKVIYADNILIFGNSLDVNFYKSFIFGLNLLLQLRNSDSEQDLDYIQCPCCGFDSRKSDFITN